MILMNLLLKPIALLTLTGLLLLNSLARAEGGSIHNHFTLDIMPLAISPGNPGGGGLGLTYDRYHDWLKSAYSITFEAQRSYGSANHIDLIANLGFFTEITRSFSIGARLGLVVNHPGSPVGVGILGLRLPALYPEKKEFFSFFYEEIDLGLAGSGERYAALRLGMLLL